MVGKRSLLFFLVHVQIISADVKTWTKNVNFDDPANWNGGGVVCSNDRKVFAKDMMASIYIQTNDTLQELRMSDNMMIVFGEGASLSFTDRPSGPSVDPAQLTMPDETTSRCTVPGRELRFEGKASSWFDFASWSLDISNSSQRFLLDMQRVPCARDEVVFPADDAFLVNMEQGQLIVGGMQVHGQTIRFDTDLERYWMSEQSRFEFQNSSVAPEEITSKGCNSTTSDCECAYPTDPSLDRERICRHHQCPVEYNCTVSLRPTKGQCCNICGALVFLNTNKTVTEFPWSSLHSTVQKVLGSFPNTVYAIGPLEQGVMQIVLKGRVDEDKGNEASLASCQILNELQKKSMVYICPLTKDCIYIDRSECIYKKFLPKTYESGLGIWFASSSVKRSDGVLDCIPPTAPPHTGKPGYWTNVVIAISVAIGVICVLLIIAGVILYRRKTSGNFKNEMELGVRGTSVQGFDNPVYDSPLPFEDSFIVTYDPHNDQMTGFENALFSPTDSGVSIDSKSSIEKKVPLESPPDERKKTKKEKKSKEKPSLGFDNPVYSVDQSHDDSMVTVSLENDEDDLPSEVQHDGVGFANPIATGLSEAAMAPEEPPVYAEVKKKKRNGAKASTGFDNPLFNESPKKDTPPAGVETIGDVKVHTKPKKSKQNGEESGRYTRMKEEQHEDEGMSNPMYDSPEENFYQPEVAPGEDFPPIYEDTP